THALLSASLHSPTTLPSRWKASSRSGKEPPGKEPVPPNQSRGRVISRVRGVGGRVQRGRIERCQSVIIAVFACRRSGSSDERDSQTDTFLLPVFAAAPSRRKATLSRIRR